MRLISDVMQSILPPGMRAPPRPARDSWTLLWLGVVLLPLAGCKARSGSTQAPAAELDDIVAIESELAKNADRLEAQGVRVARLTEAKASPADGGGISEAPAEPEASAVPPPASPPEAERQPEPVLEEADDESLPAAPRSEDALDFSRPSKKSERNEKRTSRRAPSRCERICDLAEATCTLADRICGLADEHVDDVRYEDACSRAQSQCEAASDACSACED